MDFSLRTDRLDRLESGVKLLVFVLRSGAIVLVMFYRFVEYSLLSILYGCQVLVSTRVESCTVVIFSSHG